MAGRAFEPSSRREAVRFYTSALRTDRSAVRFRPAKRAKSPIGRLFTFHKDRLQGQRPRRRRQEKMLSQRPALRRIESRDNVLIMFFSTLNAISSSERHLSHYINDLIVLWCACCLRPNASTRHCSRRSPRHAQQSDHGRRITTKTDPIRSSATKHLTSSPQKSHWKPWPHEATNQASDSLPNRRRNGSQVSLYKAEVIHRRGPWRSFEAVEFATLEWVDWFNNRRMLEPIGNIPSAEAEVRYYAMLDEPAMAA
jgi:transposase InsO family protein